jgi:hypothetical protein
MIFWRICTNLIDRSTIYLDSIGSTLIQVFDLYLDSIVMKFGQLAGHGPLCGGYVVKSIYIVQCYMLTRTIITCIEHHCYDGTLFILILIFFSIFTYLEHMRQ